MNRETVVKIRECGSCGAELLDELCTDHIAALDKIDALERGQPNCELAEIETMATNIQGLIRMMQVISGNLKRSIVAMKRNEDS